MMDTESAAEFDLDALKTGLACGTTRNTHLARLHQCLSSPAMLASLRSTEFASLSELVLGADSASVMDALLLALRRGSRHRLEAVSAIETLRRSDGEQLTIQDVHGSSGTVQAAWYGQRDVTLLLRNQLLTNSVAEISAGAFGAQAPGTLTVFVELPAEESPVKVIEELGPEAHASAWLPAWLAAALPLLQASLPKDEGGAVLPHEHTMLLVDARQEGAHAAVRNGSRVWDTGKVCDRCACNIYDASYYHCSEGCDVDFCPRCQEDLETVLQGFRRDPGRMLWTVHVVDEAAQQLLLRPHDERRAMAQQFQAWPQQLLSSLVEVIVDVCDAKLLYNCTSGALSTAVSRSERGYELHAVPLYLDGSYPFWYDVAMLQFLFACSCAQLEHVIDGDARSHRLPLHKFVLRGINRCNYRVEWDRWQVLTEATGNLSAATAVLDEALFLCPSGFRSLVAHSNLMPIAFRRDLLVHDVQQRRDVEWLKVEVEREPGAIVKALCEAVMKVPEEGGMEETEFPAEVLRPLHVTFKGESYSSGQTAAGPGVRREFFRVALQAFLAALFVPTGQRSFWFDDTPRPKEQCFSFGFLLGQVVLFCEHIPKLFPGPFYDLLLQDLASSCASSEFTLKHLAEVSQDEARSLSMVQAYSGDDITEVFGGLGWERVPCLEGRTLTQDTKEQFVSAYINWCFHEKIRDNFKPLSAGFHAVLGRSRILRTIIDAPQLESILCGSEIPVDIPAISRRATLQDWAADDVQYTSCFWSMLTQLPEEAKLQFIVFVTGSDRVPLGGWADLHLKVQKNGCCDRRLPTAYTCFSLVLLPKYSSIDVLRRNLLMAIAGSQGFGLQ